MTPDSLLKKYLMELNQAKKDFPELVVTLNTFEVAKLSNFYCLNHTRSELF